MTKEKVIPQIRFSGFTDTWEQRKVSELFKVTRGYVLAATLTEPAKTDEMPYPVYSSQTKDNGLMGYYKDYLYEDAITWTTDGANAGTVNYRAGKFYCTNVCGVLLSNEVTANQMIAEALNNVAKGYVSYVGNPKLMNNVMADIEIMIPTHAEEREKLSVFFRNLDNLITLHQRKYDKLTKVKKAMLEKMFPKNGSLYPEIRFKGFTDAWEQHKLGDHSEIVAGGTPNTGHPEYWNPKEIPWMSSGEINNKVIYSTDNMISKIGFSNSSAKWVKEKSVLIALAGQGKTRGTVAISEIPLTTNQSIAAIQPDSFLYYKFLFQNLEERYNELREVSSGDGTRGGLNKQIISDLEVLAPEIQEQIKIGDFLCGIDTLITLHQRKLEKLKNIKKACLEKMFV